MNSGALLRRTIQLTGQSGWRLLVSLVVLTAIPVYSDVGVDPRNQGFFVLLSGGATLFLQTWLTVKLLESCGQRRGNRGVAAVFGIGILSGLGIALGFILLILPGLFLLVRWSASVPIALGEDLGVTEALKESYDRTEGEFWKILPVLLVCYAPNLIVVATIALMESQGITLASSLIVNTLINLGLIAAWHAAAAVYLDGHREAELTELFA